MPFKVTYVRTRPNTNIAWLAEDDAGNTLTGEADASGKILSNNNSLAENGLQLTTVQVWANKQTYIDYINMPAVAAVRQARAIWQAANLINNSVTYEEN